MRKKLLIAGGILIAAVIAAFFYFSVTKLSDFEPAIKDKLQSLVRNATDSLYRLEFDTLQTDILNAKVTIENLRFLPDSAILLRLKNTNQPIPDIFTLSLDRVIIEGIGIKDFISSKKVDLDVLYFREPKLEIFHYKKPDTGQGKNLKTVYRNISKQMNRISLQKLVIQNMNIIRHNMKGDKIEKSSQFNNVNIALDNILIDSVTQYDDTRFLYAKQADISVADQEFSTKDSLYKIRFDTVSINAARKTATIKGIRLQPRYSKEAFIKKLPFVKERYDAQFAIMRFSNIDWWSIVASESFTAGSASLQNGRLNVYLDRSLPPFPGSKVGNYPHQLLMKLPLPVFIKNLTVSGFDISYEEFNPNSEQAGKISFQNLRGNITNITNEPLRIKHNRFMKMSAEGTLMNVAPTKASFEFDLARVKEGVFSADIHLGKMDGRLLNPVAAPVGLFSIEKGIINRADAHIEGNNYKGIGTITFLYNDLKVNTFKKGDNDKLKKRKLINFIANTFLVKNSNPEGKKPPRKEMASYDRNIKLSFFSVIFKTTLIGMMKTIGLGIAIKKLK